MIHHPGDQALKIGFSEGDPGDRMRSLQTGPASLLELAGVIPEAPMRVEKELHAKFNKYRRRSNGEWFEDSLETRVLVLRLWRRSARRSGLACWHE